MARQEGERTRQKVEIYYSPLYTSVVTLQYFLWTAKLSSVFREDLMDYYQKIIPDGIQLVE